MDFPHLYGLWATFLLIFVRFVGFFVQAPIWGSHHANHQVLVGSALCFSIIVFPTVHPPETLMAWKTHYGSVMTLTHLALLIFQQFAVGLIMGYISFLSMVVAQFAGELFDVQMGLSVAASFDPASHGASNLLNRLSFYVGMILYLLCGGHMITLTAVKKSFELIPVDYFSMNKPLLEHIYHSTGDIFLLALQMASPVVCSLFIVQVALGMVARAAPQMNVFMLSFPMNIGIGLTILTASFPFMTDKYYQLFRTDNETLAHVIKLMGAHAP